MAIVDNLSLAGHGGFGGGRASITGTWANAPQWFKTQNPRLSVFTPSDYEAPSHLEQAVDDLWSLYFFAILVGAALASQGTYDPALDVMDFSNDSSTDDDIVATPIPSMGMYIGPGVIFYVV